MANKPVPERNERSDVVLRAATRIFLAHGFSASTTDMIQREAGVSKATVYACYQNKEALFAAVIQRECAIMTDTMRALHIERGRIRQTLNELGLSYLKIVLSPVGLALFRVVVADAVRFPELAREFYLAGPRVIAAMVADVLSEAVAAGELDLQHVGIENAASLFASLLRGEGQLECLLHPQAAPSEAQLDHWANVAVNAFLAAYELSPHALPQRTTR